MTQKCWISAARRFTCRHLTGDDPSGREEKQESQETGEKCIHVPQRGRTSKPENCFPQLFQKFCFSTPQRCSSVVSSVYCCGIDAISECLFVIPAAEVCSGAPFSLSLPPAGCLVSISTGARGRYYTARSERARVTDRQWGRNNERTAHSVWRHEAETIWKKGIGKKETSNACPVRQSVACFFLPNTCL